MTDSELNRYDLIEAAKNAQRSLESPLTRKKFIELTGISEWQINKLFPLGRWTEIREQAGIKRHPLDRREYTDEELISEFHRVTQEGGSIPTWAIFTAEAEVSREVLSRRFGGLKGTLQKYAEWLKEKHPDSPFLEAARGATRHAIPSPPIMKSSKDTEVPSLQWNKISGAEFGAPIDFRGLRHAPINEQGVVYLFGIVSYELGFIVEAVHAAYPDCEAKRQISKDRWQRVRIEFEFKSSNFRDHGHNPAEADLIVCWHHNWIDCPLEVLELRSAIDNLDP